MYRSMVPSRAVARAISDIERLEAQGRQLELEELARYVVQVFAHSARPWRAPSAEEVSTWLELFRERQCLVLRGWVLTGTMSVEWAEFYCKRAV